MVDCADCDSFMLCKYHYSPLSGVNIENVDDKVEDLVLLVSLAANMRLCMGSRRGFIIRMRLGDVAVDPMSSPSQPVRARHRSTLGPSSDGRQYAVVHVTGYIRNWPPTSEFVSGMCEYLAHICINLFT